MKWIRYERMIGQRNIGTEEAPVLEAVFEPKMISYCEANVQIAGREARNGEYEIADDGQPDPAEQPSQLDRVEAQVTYTAMMTDTLLEV